MVIFYGDGCLEEVFYRIFGTVLMNFLNNSFTAHLGLPFFLGQMHTVDWTQPDPSLHITTNPGPEIGLT